MFETFIKSSFLLLFLIRIVVIFENVGKSAAFYNVLQTRKTIHRILSIPPRFLPIESTNLESPRDPSNPSLITDLPLPRVTSVSRSILSQCNDDDDDDDDDEPKPVAINFLQR